MYFVVLLLTTILYKQVEGTLKIANAYSTPFEPVCAICNFPASASASVEDTTIDCMKCNQKCHFLYRHCINGIIRSITNSVVQCIIREPILQTLLPDLIQMPYEIYLQKKLDTVYMLRDLQVHNKFTLNEDNIVLQIG
jgi:hypothetical protein